MAFLECHKSYVWQTHSVHLFSACCNQNLSQINGLAAFILEQYHLIGKPTFNGTHGLKVVVHSNLFYQITSVPT